MPSNSKMFALIRDKGTHKLKTLEIEKVKEIDLKKEGFVDFSAPIIAKKDYGVFSKTELRLVSVLRVSGDESKLQQMVKSPRKFNIIPNPRKSIGDVVFKASRFKDMNEKKKSKQEEKAAEASALQAAKSVENSIRKKHNDKKVKEKDASGNLQAFVSCLKTKEGGSGEGAEVDMNPAPVSEDNNNKESKGQKRKADAHESQSTKAVKLDTTTLTDKEKLEAANQKIMELEACKKVLEDTVHKEIKKIPDMVNDAKRTLFKLLDELPHDVSVANTKCSRAEERDGMIHVAQGLYVSRADVSELNDNHFKFTSRVNGLFEKTVGDGNVTKWSLSGENEATVVSSAFTGGMTRILRAMDWTDIAIPLPKQMKNKKKNSQDDEKDKGKISENLVREQVRHHIYNSKVKADPRKVTELKEKRDAKKALALEAKAKAKAQDAKNSETTSEVDAKKKSRNNSKDKKEPDDDAKNSETTSEVVAKKKSHNNSKDKKEPDLKLNNDNNSEENEDTDKTKMDEDKEDEVNKSDNQECLDNSLVCDEEESGDDS